MGVTFTKIDFPGAAWTQANGINRHGPLLRSVQIVGTYSDISGTHGFLLSDGDYTTLNVPGGRNTAAYGINGHGQIVGTYEDARGVTQSFLLDSGTYTPFSECGDTPMSLYGINNSGSVVGSIPQPTSPQVDGFAFVADAHECISEPAPVNGKTEVFGINDIGQNVGYQQSSENDGRIIRGLSFKTLIGGGRLVIDAPGATLTVCRGVNDNGVICGYAKYGATFGAFVIDQGVFTTFDFPGAPWTEAHGINNPTPGLALDTSFDVVGLYTESSLGHSHGFVANVSVPHLVKWDGREWVEQEVGAGAVIHQRGKVVPAT